MENSKQFTSFKHELNEVLREMEFRMGTREYSAFKHEAFTLVSSIERTMHRSHPTLTKSGSQFNEDEILANLLPEASGFYVDCGAGHPIECSNTWNLYRRGWRGLLIECLPSSWNALLRHRPGDFLCPLAAYDSTGFARLRVAQSVSSVRPDWDISETAELIVECDTLMNILKPFPSIRSNCSLLSIDVEGVEANVLRGIDFAVFHPKVIVVEAMRYHPYEERSAADDLTGEWEGILSGNGYKLTAANQLNKIYAMG